MNSNYSVPQAVVHRHRDVFIVDLPGQYDHRGMVLRSVCELENAMALLLMAFLRSVNPALADSRARKELFSENGLIGSLSKMSRLATHLGIIDEDMDHDIRIMVRLRNQYAHGLHRDQFYRDPATSPRFQ